MNQSCQICQDLIPLVNDEVASEASVQFVMDHVASCQQCQALANRPTKLPSQASVLAKVRKRLWLHFGMIFILGMFLITASDSYEHSRLNILILPLVGALSYFNQGKRYYQTLILILGMDLVGYYLTNRNLADSWMTFGYHLILFFIGVAIGALLKYGLRKEDK